VCTSANSVRTSREGEAPVAVAASVAAAGAAVIHASSTAGDVADSVLVPLGGAVVAFPVTGNVVLLLLLLLLLVREAMS
jgi:hypothetical protein